MKRSPCLLAVLSVGWLVATTNLAVLGQEPDTGAVFSALADRDPEEALVAVGALNDRGITLRDLTYTALPSAVAGVHRALAQLSSDEQYELLAEWTLPAEGRDGVRLLSVPTPTDAPPKVFARSLGERPRDDTFAISTVELVRGFFCSGWMLVQAADDLGRLARLRSTLEELAADDVAGAQELLMLAHVAGTRGRLDQVQEFLQRHVDEPGDDVAPVEFKPSDVHLAAIAAAATRHEQLQPLAESLLEKLVQRAGEENSIALRPFLRIAHAVAVQTYRGESPPDALFQNRLKHWLPTAIRTARDIDRGQPSAIWLTHEQHVLHLAGGTTDVLFCRFPITGEFDFICETQEGGSIGTDGGLVYGGLHFQALGRKDTLQVWDADKNHPVTKASPFARHDNRPVFNRVSIRSRDQTAQFESNFHPVWFDKNRHRASPWIGLRSSGTKRPVFRNLELTGKPVIPRHVELLQQDSLRGWQSGFFGETQPGFSSEGENEEQPSPTFDWQMKDADLLSAKHTDENAERPGLLQYQRPLQEGEFITYEFFHGGAETIVHPALGRLAFLLEPTGVRIRWIITGPYEWTGLPADNAALEPLSRRGPRPLPLNEDDWNTLKIGIVSGKVEVTLNDQLVYQRPLEPGAQTQFGLYRPSRREEARVRRAVMTGEWPEKPPEDFLKDPVQLVRPRS